MAFWNRNQSNDTVVRQTSSGFFGWFGWGDSSPTTPKTADEALEISAVFAAIRVLSNDIGRMPINLYKKEKDNGLTRRTVDEDHPYHRLLAVKPNSWMTSTELLRAIVVQAALGKGCLCVLNKVAGQVREIYPIPAGAWTQEILSTGNIQYTVTYANSQRQTFDQSTCLFVHSGLSLDGYSSVSALDKARHALGVAKGLESQQSKFASSGGRPSGVLSFENELTPETKKSLAETWKQRWGAGGEGGIAVLDGNARFDALTTTFADAQFMESREFVIYEVARFFGVSPQKLFAKGATSYASARENTLAHISDALMPWVVSIEQALNRDILGNDPNYYFDLDEKDLLRGRNEQQAGFLTKLLGAGGTPAVISTNEARYELGLDPLEGDEYQKPSKGGYAEAAGMSEQETDK
ncbi:phage portal protein [Paracoccus sp. (in: a-proteobacteria)]|uniref:phage portal protein n=1 Tax=Paracoccus sp. TaxID=267 RepID=UPI004058D643